MLDFIVIYWQNRREFYQILAARIPQPGLRLILDRIVRAAQIEKNPDLPHFILSAKIEADPLLQALLLRDLLKKPDLGTALGRFTISFSEALSRAQAIEETGLLLFSRLSALNPVLSSPFSEAAARHQAALSEILHESDALRYHRQTL